MIYLALACAGGFGSLARYLADKNIAHTAFPLPTFLINIVGSFLIGAIYVLGTEKGLITKDMAMIVAAGFLGGFTTFSAYALQTVLLAENGQAALAAAYFVASPIASALFAFGGIWLTRSFA